MLEGETDVQSASNTPRRNWWKIAFFITLFAFEVAREVAVLALDSEAKPSTNGLVTSFDEFVTAQGTWKRIDGGGELTPAAVTIECWQAAGQCTEATVMFYDGYVFAPDISTYNANFTTDSVTYENTTPACVSYSVRIDLKLQKAFSVRTKNDGKLDEICKGIEPRIEMQLTDGFEIVEPNPKDRFVPIIEILLYAFR